MPNSRVVAVQQVVIVFQGRIAQRMKVIRVWWVGFMALSDELKITMMGIVRTFVRPVPLAVTRGPIVAVILTVMMVAPIWIMVPSVNNGP